MTFLLWLSGLKAQTILSTTEVGLLIASEAADRESTFLPGVGEVNLLNFCLKLRRLPWFLAGDAELESASEESTAFVLLDKEFVTSGSSSTSSTIGERSLPRELEICKMGETYLVSQTIGLHVSIVHVPWPRLR